MLLDKNIIIPDLGPVGPESGFHLLETTEDGKFITGKNGVENIVATGDKKVEFLHLKDLLPTTGYIRGGCSPIGMKKRFPTYLHESAKNFETIVPCPSEAYLKPGENCDVKLNTAEK